MKRRHSLPVLPLLAAAVLCVTALTAQAARAQAGPAKGLGGRLIVGYQGWFGCPGDYDGNDKWQHLFTGRAPRADTLAVDLLPSVRGFDADELCGTGMQSRDGSPVCLYSPQDGRVVERHFKWMEKHGIDGAALQRFIGPVSCSSVERRRSDHVALNARRAAEKAGRVFFIAYDVSGAGQETVADDIEADWRHLTADLKLTESPGYLREEGRPVLEVWGFGFTDRPGTPETALRLIQDLKTGAGGLEAVTLIGGVPADWRTLGHDSRSDPAWARVYRSYDVISPWTVGRFKDDAGADASLRERVLPDIAETRRLGIGYMPVVFPGFSWSNLMGGRGRKDLAVFNQIPRRCGRFLWRQVSNLLGAGAGMLYAAMFDELDEGTALFPVVARADGLPEGAHVVSLDQDGCPLPDDWYLRVIGKAGEFLRRRETPPRELDAVLRP